LPEVRGWAETLTICNILIPVAGATRAEDKMATISKLPLEIDALSLLAVCTARLRMRITEEL
jgi:hypothetical protein